MVKHFIANPWPAEMHGRKVAHHQVKGVVLLVTSPSSNPAVHTVLRVGYGNGTRTGGGIILAMVTETAVVKAYRGSLGSYRDAGLSASMPTYSRTSRAKVPINRATSMATL